MNDQNDELSSTQFLSDLAATGAAAGPTIDSAHSSIDMDELDLDFSDLDDLTSQPPAGDGDASPNPADADNSTSSAESEISAAPVEVGANSSLADLFDRVSSVLGDTVQTDEDFRPKLPETLTETGLTFEEIERIIMKFLFSKGSATGREICLQVSLPYSIIDGILKELKQEQMVAYKSTAEMGDYDFAITDRGRDRARTYNRECTYFGAAPVVLKDYLHAMERQSIAKQLATEEDVHAAFSDLIMNMSMLDRLGPAINSGRGMFLYGEPGNGKTSIAERVTRCFGSTIYIPKALGIDGDIVRLYDPGVHQVIDMGSRDGLFDLSGVDQRWVQIVRPTVIAGGELTMSELEICQNLQTKICEAPLQLKSNCGTFVIDDFGRQTMPIEELLNRWIMPLEKRFDFLNLPSGKKIQVPFDQLIIFSTNLQPKDLIDGAFLCRIPYKIEVPDPTEEEFYQLFQLVAPHMGFEYDQESVRYLIETHYRSRPFRSCQPRDLLAQVKNLCIYKQMPKKMSPEAFDFAVENYFAIM